MYTMPALRALWYCDSNTPCMVKLFYLSHRTTVLIENSQDDLNHKSLFGSLKTDQNSIEEGNIVLGSNLNDSTNNDEDELVFHEPPPVTLMVLMMNTATMKAVMMKHRHQVIQPCHLHVR